TGYPPKSERSSDDPQVPLIPKIFWKKLILPERFSFLRRQNARRELANIKGNSEGIRVFMQRLSPDLTPSADGEGKHNNRIKKVTASISPIMPVFCFLFLTFAENKCFSLCKVLLFFPFTYII